MLRRRRLARAGVEVRIQCPKVDYGQNGGTWTVCPDRIDSNSVVYSFGIGRDLSFDLDLIDRHGTQINAFDPTPACVQWIRTQELPANLSFHEYGLANFDGDLEFYPPRKTTSAHFTPVKRYESNSGPPFKAPVRKLTTIMQELGHQEIDVLKMDIEGGEYDVIADIVNRGIPIGQLLVEFHHNYETIPFTRTVDAVLSLEQIGFRVFAISPRTYEISLINVGQQDKSSVRGKPLR